jgi:molybdopterin/thiamine biosynthesis adenylyltransferase
MMLTYADRVASQRPLMGADGIRKTSRAKVLFAGAGGLGTPAAIFAARSGFEIIYQADPQKTEPDNLNRVVGAGRHVGRYKAEVNQEYLKQFDRAEEDPYFKYLPLLYPIEHQVVRPYLVDADVVVACQNKADSRLWLLKFAVEHQKLLFNVGFGCEPGRFMGGEISIYRPNRSDLACPACISLRAGITVPPTMFFPPLAVLAALTVQLIIAEITGFDLYGSERPNYIVFDALRYSLRAYRVPADTNCGVCRR